MAGNIVTKIDNAVPVRNVIVSVSNKAGLEQFIPALMEVCPGVHFYSTGGTYSSIEKVLGAKAKSVLTQVSDYTGQPETQAGWSKHWISKYTSDFLPRDIMTPIPPT